MNLPTVLLQWKERPIGQWVGAGNRFLPQLATAVLVIAIAYQAAKLTWALMPREQLDVPLPVLSAPTTPAERVATGSLDLGAILDRRLFGEADATPPPVVTTVVDAPDTTLSLELTGVVASEDTETGWAIISAARGATNTYSVGDTVEGTGGAVLHAVYENRVILNRAGRLETLRLPEELASGPAPRVMPQRPVAQQPNDSLRDLISENATRLTEVIRVAPYIDQGQMVGFRLNPGQNRELYDSLGLQPNDVVTDINGTALTDPSSGLQVFQALGEATMANVTIIRNGTPEVLVIDTSQLQQLSEGRQ